MTYYTKKNAHILNVMLFCTGIIIAKGHRKRWMNI